jgi:hypothetical protein
MGLSRAVCGSASLPYSCSCEPLREYQFFTYAYGWGPQTFAIFHRHKVSNPYLFEASGYRACAQEQPVNSTHRGSRYNGYCRVSIRQRISSASIRPDVDTLDAGRRQKYVQTRPEVHVYGRSVIQRQLRHHLELHVSLQLNFPTWQSTPSRAHEY